MKTPGSISLCTVLHAEEIKLSKQRKKMECSARCRGDVMFTFTEETDGFRLSGNLRSFPLTITFLKH